MKEIHKQVQFGSFGVKPAVLRHLYRSDGTVKERQLLNIIRAYYLVLIADLGARKRYHSGSELTLSTR
ncbi:hypothetical protein J6590_054982 [Homalodisca vitripennis]|nr:hypothetical protein J6590_054982 [Homalodisca vitripennis]